MANKHRTLLIVESPTKAETIQQYLGDDYIVLASKGHITDLAKGGKNGMGIDIDNDFKPHYVLSEDKLFILDQLLAAAKEVDNIVIFSDPDREGEAIAWHLAQRLADTDKPIKRITSSEIKKSKILEALKSPRDIDMNIVHSQEGRRILDRLVGFTASPFLIGFLGAGLSAGRVQSVVTRMVIDREREIEAFIPEEFFTIQVNLSKGDNGFITKYSGKLTNSKDAEAMKAKLIVKDAEYIVSEVKSDEELKGPNPPLITSTLQQIMSRAYGFDASKTMRVSQSIFEQGFISYHRTDSLRVGDESLLEAREFLTSNNYKIPKKPNVFKNKDAAQDAHECIRPTDLTLLPHDNFAIINPDEKIVYEVIWKSFLASQMLPAVYSTLKVTANVKGDKSAEVKASGKAIKNKGYLELFGGNNDSKIDIPDLSVGDILHTFGELPVRLEKKQTQPPPRFSEYNLIKELDKRSIGRPATYAELLSKIAVRNYVEKRGNVYHATDLGKKITDILVKYFSFLKYDYTSDMEEQLDQIAQGKVNHVDMLKKFYEGYKKELNLAYKEFGGDICYKCNAPMGIRTAKVSGDKFLFCTAYPKCKNTKSLDISKAVD